MWSHRLGRHRRHVQRGELAGARLERGEAGRRRSPRQAWWPVMPSQSPVQWPQGYGMSLPRNTPTGAGDGRSAVDQVGAAVKPARSGALTTFTPGIAGRDSAIRRRLASAHPEDRTRRATLPSASRRSAAPASVGPSPTAPTPTSHSRRRAATGWSRSRRLVQPDRLGEHDMPPPFSRQRRRPVTEAGYIRLFPA